MTKIIEKYDLSFLRNKYILYSLYFNILISVWIVALSFKFNDNGVIASEKLNAKWWQSSLTSNESTYSSASLSVWQNSDNSFIKWNQISQYNTAEHRKKVERILTNDTDILKKYWSLSYRNNNPWNLRYNNQMWTLWKDWNWFAIFETYEAGHIAHMRQIYKDSERWLNVTQFINKYAPNSENFGDNYINIIVNSFPWTSWSTLISTLDHEHLQKIMQDIEWWIEPEEKTEEIFVAEEWFFEESQIEDDIVSRVWCYWIEDVKKRINCVRKKL